MIGGRAEIAADKREILAGTITITTFVLIDNAIDRAELFFLLVYGYINRISRSQLNKANNTLFLSYKLGLKFRFEKEIGQLPIPYIQT